LPSRTLDFEQELLEVVDFQGTLVMNLADEDDPWTRTRERLRRHHELARQERTSTGSRATERPAPGSPFAPANV
jgi:UDP-galactopyranose mutase